MDNPGESVDNPANAAEKPPDKADEEKREAERQNAVRLAGVMNCWNATLGKRGFPEVVKASPHRLRAFRARLEERRERASPLWWEALFQRVAASSFMREAAQRHEGWLNFDWFLNESNLVKLCEGRYDNDKTRPRARDSPQRDAWANVTTDYDEAMKNLHGGCIDVDAREVKAHDETGLSRVLPNNAGRGDGYGGAEWERPRENAACALRGAG